jgi:hypothetical protein
VQLREGGRAPEQYGEWSEHLGRMEKGQGSGQGVKGGMALGQGGQGTWAGFEGWHGTRDRAPRQDVTGGRAPEQDGEGSEYLGRREKGTGHLV